MARPASSLRAELSRLARQYAEGAEIAFYESRGAPPVTLFKANKEGSCHGNFEDASYRAILDDPDWAKRLAKSHSAKGVLPDEHKDGAKELDSCNSSDALLMNCFCYPQAAATIFRDLLPELRTGRPEFGIPGEVPLSSGGVDTTEIDMRAGHVIFESKLTEADFTSRSKAHVERYRDFALVFEPSLLPQSAQEYHGYQLIRNVLAAAEHDYDFRLICDARRPDLLRYWWLVYGAIREGRIRARCGFLLWQEIASSCPLPLQSFLKRKYGLPVAA